MENQIEQPIVETPVEQSYTYQPTDGEGRPIGGKQVIKYTTQDELVQKLQEQNILLIRKLRQETKNNRLGISEKETLSDDLQRFSGPIEFHPRELTEDERYELSRDLLDPAKASDAASRLIEARIGAPLDALGKTLQDVQQHNLNLQAKIEANAFVQENPDYFRCNENFEAISSWMVRYDLAPVKENFQKAYDTLRAQGILIEGAAPTPVVETPEPEHIYVVEQPVVEETIREQLPVEKVTVQAPRIPVSLTRENTSDSGPTVKTGSDITYEIVVQGQKRVLTGLAAVAAMPSDEYKRRLLHDKGFAKQIDKLEADARKPRQQ